MTLLASIVDCFWPRLEPFSKEQEESEREKRKAASDLVNSRLSAEGMCRCNATSETVLREVLGAAGKLLAAEEDRRAHVQARLTSILGLTSIASAVAFGLLTNMFAKGFQSPKTIGLYTATIASVYVLLQLSRALLAAIDGLGRTSVLSLTAADILPEANECSSTYLTRQIQNTIDCAQDMGERNQHRVNCIALAHRALKNFLCGVMVLVIILAFLIVFARPASDPLATQIQQVAESLSKITALKGDVGPAGPIGPMGPPGPSGSAGDQCVAAVVAPCIGQASTCTAWTPAGVSLSTCDAQAP
jgi:hypothetical protein